MGAFFQNLYHGKDIFSNKSGIYTFFSHHPYPQKHHVKLDLKGIVYIDVDDVDESFTIIACIEEQCANTLYNNVLNGNKGFSLNVPMNAR